jgi:hypothetical protein
MGIGMVIWSLILFSMLKGMCHFCVFIKNACISPCVERQIIFFGFITICLSLNKKFMNEWPMISLWLNINLFWLGFIPIIHLWWDKKVVLKHGISLTVLYLMSPHDIQIFVHQIPADSWHLKTHQLASNILSFPIPLMTLDLVSSCCCTSSPSQLAS